jgi:hypothetical protein
MKYVMLIYQGTTPLPGTPAWDALPPEEQQRVYAEYNALNELPGVTPGLPLGMADDATTVRVADGRPLVTDGPYVSTKEAIGGWFVVEAEDLDEAIAVAARVPAARLGGGIEVRPVQTYW